MKLKMLPEKKNCFQAIDSLRFFIATLYQHYRRKLAFIMEDNICLYRSKIDFKNWLHVQMKQTFTLIFGLLSILWFSNLQFEYLISRYYIQKLLQFYLPFQFILRRVYSAVTLNNKSWKGFSCKLWANSDLDELTQENSEVQCRRRICWKCTQKSCQVLLNCTKLSKIFVNYIHKHPEIQLE